MFRSFFNWLSKMMWAQRLITRWRFAWRFASRFVAGETVQQAIGVVGEINRQGIQTSLDQLGESTATVEDAARATQGILRMLDEIQATSVRSNVSIKLSQIGMGLDDNLCRANLRGILERAQGYRNFVRIDMEDHPFTDTTLGLYNEMCAAGFDNVGVVIQAYLYRSEDDIRAVAGKGGRVRLCKGAYKEPPSVALPTKPQVDENYDKLARLLLDLTKANGAPPISADFRIPPIAALATHDPKRINNAILYAEDIGLDKRSFEFQMLYGIRRDLQNWLADEGYLVRVYVPFGTHWYPYLMRRMGERPANLWFIVSNFFRK